MTPDQAKFEAIRERWQQVQSRRESHEWKLYDAYRSRRPPMSWQTRTEVKRGEAIQAAQSRVMDAMTALLDRIGGRDWRSGAPCHWIMEELTFADAVSTGQLSVVPPPSYGHTTRDAERFASSRQVAA